MSSNAKKRRQSVASSTAASASNGSVLLGRRREHVAQIHANNPDGLFKLKLKTSASFLASTLPTQSLDSSARRQRFLRSPGTAAGRSVKIEGSIMSFGESRVEWLRPKRGLPARGIRCAPLRSAALRCALTFVPSLCSERCRPVADGCACESAGGARGVCACTTPTRAHSVQQPRPRRFVRPSLTALFGAGVG